MSTLIRPLLGGEIVWITSYQQLRLYYTLGLLLSPKDLQVHNFSNLLAYEVDNDIENDLEIFDNLQKK